MDNKINREQKWIKATKKTFDLIAKRFSETRKKKDEVLDYFFSIFNPCGHTLEIGCGDARSLDYLEKKGFFAKPENFYLGIDYSRKLLSKAKKRRQNKIFNKKIEFALKDILNLRFRNKFDSIFALAVIHHLPLSFQTIALQNIFQALKKNGRFAGYVWAPKKPFIKKWRKIGKREYFKFWQNNKDWPIFYYLFKKTELKNLLINLGFKKISIFKNKTNFPRIKENIFFIAQK